jgi:hypothetical protein
MIESTDASPGVASSSSRRIPLRISAREGIGEAFTGSRGPNPLVLRARDALSPAPLLVYVEGLVLFLRSKIPDPPPLGVSLPGVDGERVSAALATPSPMALGGVAGVEALELPPDARAVDSSEFPGLTSMLY